MVQILLLDLGCVPQEEKVVQEGYLVLQIFLVVQMEQVLAHFWRVEQVVVAQLELHF